MGAAEKVPIADAKHDFVPMTLHACELARDAAHDAGEALGSGKTDLFDRVMKAEQELDEIDHDLDERVSLEVTQVDAERARELLACMKFGIDLERIGDLLASFATQARELGANVDPESRQQLVQMAHGLEHMLNEVHCAFSTRDVKCAINVLRSDGELDRLRNLIFFRFAEQHQHGGSAEGVRLVFMSHAIERAGDHAKNLAEEVIHFITGHSVRHVLSTQGKRSWEQMYIDSMRERPAQPS
jgi:phosphate transport system protein